MSGCYFAPRLLADTDDLSVFNCRSVEQTRWLRRNARQAAAAGTARVLVVTEPGGSVVVAYYAWCMANIAGSAVPVRMRKGAGRYRLLG